MKRMYEAGARETPQMYYLFIQGGKTCVLTVVSQTKTKLD